MASNRYRAGRSIANKINELDSRQGNSEKDISNPNIEAGYLVTDHFADGSVTGDKVADRTVSGQKISRGAINTEHLGIVNNIVSDSTLTLTSGPGPSTVGDTTVVPGDIVLQPGSTGYLVLDGDMYVPPTSPTIDVLGLNSLSQVVVTTINANSSLPPGGTAGQILSKVDGTDYNTQWIDEAPAASYTQTIKHQVKLGEAITKGQAVYVSSANGTNMIVSKASNATEATSSKTMGLLETGGSTNAFVNVITEGLLSGLDTHTASAGDPVWLGTSGNLIYGLTNKPYAPAHLVFIGVVTRANSNNGEIFVRPQNGFELDELHDVSIGHTATKTDGDLIQYVGADGVWKNVSTIATAKVSGLDDALSSKLPLAGGSMTGLIVGKTNTGGAISGSNDSGALSVRGDGSNAASISFHRPGIYAINMGLDTDNVFRIGGWSNTNYVSFDTGGTLYSTGHNYSPYSAYAESAGLVSLNGGSQVAASVSVTFPAGRFSQVPVVNVNCQSASAYTLVGNAGSISSSGFVLYGRHVLDTSTWVGPYIFGWHAVQMTTSAYSAGTAQ